MVFSQDLLGVPPLLPACKSNGCNGLAEVIAAKILQPNGLRPKYCQQTTYRLKCESPSRCRGFFDLYIQYTGSNLTKMPTLFSFV
jgi:hypothetical protein